MVKIEVSFEGTKVLDVLIEAKDSTDVGRLSFEAADESRKAIADYWIERFLSIRGPTGFPLLSGDASYEELLYVIGKIGNGWHYSCSNPPPKGSPIEYPEGVFP